MKPRAQAFVTAYLKTMTHGKGNATKAAEMAGFSKRSAYIQGARMMKNDEVSAAISATLQIAQNQAIVDATYVPAKIKEVAERCMTHKPVMEFDREAKEMRPTGTYEFDSAGANRALELLGKHLKLFTDRIEIQSTQIEKLLGEVIFVLKSTIPEEYWPKVAEKLARVSETYGSHDAALS